jgi:hypothetical protein
VVESNHSSYSHLQGPGVLLHTIRKGDGIIFPKKGDLCVVRVNEAIEGMKGVDSVHLLAGRRLTVPAPSALLSRFLRCTTTYI